MFVRTKANPAFKGGSEPLENEINAMLGTKCEDQFSNPFFELVQNMSDSLFVLTSAR